MRKNINILFIGIFAIFSACTEKGTLLWGDLHEIYFDKFYMDALPPGRETADTTKVSFFFIPDGVNETTAEVVVNMTGRLLTQDMPFKLKVVEDGTTAGPDEYSLEENYVFRANNVGAETKVMNDTIRIKFLRSPRLKSLEKGVTLKLELVPLGDLQLGQLERRRAMFILTEVAVKPLWWTREVEEELLGTYSHKKYKLFLLHADTNAEVDEALIKRNPSKAIAIARKFKEWLGGQNPPVTEEDGSLMKVNV